MCTGAPTRQRSTQFMNASEWTFPTSTCETPVDHLPRQPWSSLVNAAIIGMMLCRRRTNLVYSIIQFETIHLCAHVTYSTQLSVMQHFSTNLVLHFYAKSGKFTNIAQAIDCAVVAFVGGLWQVFSGFCLFFTYKFEDTRVRIGGTIVMLMMFNEHLFCIRMLQFADLPYHCVLELVGMYVFYCMTEERKKSE